MHTVTVLLASDGNVIEYRVVHKNTLSHVIARFDPAGDTEDNTAIDNAAHFCNRLNGGFSSELAALVRKFNPILDFVGQQMEQERTK